MRTRLPTPLPIAARISATTRPIALAGIDRDLISTGDANTGTRRCGQRQHDPERGTTEPRRDDEDGAEASHATFVIAPKR